MYEDFPGLPSDSDTWNLDVFQDIVPFRIDLNALSYPADDNTSMTQEVYKALSIKIRVTVGVYEEVL